jgi:hypothetical protein
MIFYEDDEKILVQENKKNMKREKKKIFGQVTGAPNHKPEELPEEPSFDKDLMSFRMKIFEEI